MLNNKKTFEKLMALLCSIDPDVPLPDKLETILWNVMMEEDYCFQVRELEGEGEIPKKAYYVVKGFVLVYGFSEKLDKFVMRIYCENSILAMNCFMRQKKSKFTIVASRDSLVWSISSKDMKNIYSEMPGMEEFAWKTAAEYHDAKELMRNELLALEPEERIWTFYQRFKGLFPAKKSPVKDADIAGFLGMKLGTFRKLRKLVAEKHLRF